MDKNNPLYSATTKVPPRMSQFVEFKTGRISTLPSNS
jgi:hypothetical protein